MLDAVHTKLNSFIKVRFLEFVILSYKLQTQTSLFVHVIVGLPQMEKVAYNAVHSIASCHTCGK